MPLVPCFQFFGVDTPRSGIGISYHTIFYSGYIILPSHQRTRGPISAHSHQNLLLLVFFQSQHLYFFFFLMSDLICCSQDVSFLTGLRLGSRSSQRRQPPSLGNLFQVFSFDLHSLGQKFSIFCSLLLNFLGMMLLQSKTPTWQDTRSNKMLNPYLLCLGAFSQRICGHYLL